MRCRILALLGLAAVCLLCRADEIRQGDDWIVFEDDPEIKPGSALDISRTVPLERPAGRHGWLVNRNGHFEFEHRYGVSVRFFGINLCCSTACPLKSESDVLVPRLVRAGYNSVRIHHVERELLRNGETQAVDAGSLDRLDYLVARCIEAGLYVTIDLYVSRPVAWSEMGFPDKDGLASQNEVKACIQLFPEARENWKRAAGFFLDHVNPYTGRRYADEPGMPLVSLVNEGQMFTIWESVKDMPEVRERYAKWLSEKSLTPKDDSLPRGALLHSFFADMERRTIGECRAYLKSLGVKAMITSLNCGDWTEASAALRLSLDYVDTHAYVDHPVHLDERNKWGLPSGLDNRDPVSDFDNYFLPARCIYERIWGRPFVMSEWNYSGPGERRGAGGLLMGTVASFQAWDGLWRFCYAHSSERIRKGRWVPGYFDIASDPVTRYSEWAVAALYLRGDAKSAAGRVALEFDAEAAVAPHAGKVRGVWKKVPHLALKAQCGLAAQGLHGAYAVLPLASCTDTIASRWPVDPQCRIDPVRGVFSIATEKTCGIVTKAGVRESAGALTADVFDAPASVWLSSLDNLPIHSSSRLVLFHLTDAKGEGCRFEDANRCKLLSWGYGRTLVRSGCAAVHVSLGAAQDYEVYALSANGSRRRRIDAKSSNDGLAIPLSVRQVDGGCLCYEITKKGKKDEY